MESFDVKRLYDSSFIDIEAFKIWNFISLWINECRNIFSIQLN
jgi:hypothetical protein